MGINHNLPQEWEQDGKARKLLRQIVSLELTISVSHSSEINITSSYQLMLKCWSLNPDHRPTPVDLVANLSHFDGTGEENNGASAVQEEVRGDATETKTESDLTGLFNIILLSPSLVVCLLRIFRE